MKCECDNTRDNKSNESMITRVSFLRGGIKELAAQAARIEALLDSTGRYASPPGTRENFLVFQETPPRAMCHRSMAKIMSGSCWKLWVSVGFASGGPLLLAARALQGRSLAPVCPTGLF